MQEVWILRERDYYDNNSVTGVTTRQDIADYWDSLPGCWTETAEIDSLSDYRLEKFRAAEWSREKELKS